LVGAMLAKDPAARPADMGEVGAALDQIARSLNRAGGIEAGPHPTEPTFPPRTLVTPSERPPERRPSGRSRLLAAGALGVLLVSGGVVVASRLHGGRGEPER